MPTMRYITAKSRARAAEAMRMRRAGMTFRAIGEVMGVGRSYAQTLAAMGERQDARLRRRETAQPLSPETSLDALPFTVRTANVLHFAGVKTIGDLLKVSEKQVKRMKNAGAKTIDDIRETMLDMGMVWPGLPVEGE